jgi:hypothetical protein
MGLTLVSFVLAPIQVVAATPSCQYPVLSFHLRSSSIFNHSNLLVCLTAILSILHHSLTVQFNVWLLTIPTTLARTFHDAATKEQQ